MPRTHYRELLSRVQEVARRAGRTDEVTLVAVSKRQPVELLRDAYEQGCRDFGENYVQELKAKEEALADLSDIRWHFIGHLQRNKVKHVVGSTALLHAVDSPRLAETISTRAQASGLVQPVLLEVNVGLEESKAGVDPEGTAALLDAMTRLPGIRVEGLMTMPPFLPPEEARPYFAALRNLRDQLVATVGLPEGWQLPYLSMGMSGDFEAAIGEGATHVRIGTAIFGARD